MIETLDEFLRRRGMDDINPDQEGFEVYNRERGIIPRWVDYKMAKEAKPTSLEN